MLRPLALAILVAGGLAAAPAVACAQRVVVTPPWTPSRADSVVILRLRAGVAPPALLADPKDTVFRAYRVQVIGFAADSLIVRRLPAPGAFHALPGPAFNIPAAFVDRVMVQRWSERAARRDTGGETGFYAGLLGAGAGALGGLVAKHPGAGAAIGFAGGFVAGYLYGSRHPYLRYGYRWEEHRIAAAP